MGGGDGEQETSYDAVAAKWAGATRQLPVRHRKVWEQEMTEAGSERRRAVWVQSIWRPSELSVNSVTDYRISNRPNLITRIRLLYYRYLHLFIHIVSYSDLNCK